MKGLISAAFIAMLIGCGGGGTAVEDLPDSPDILKEEAKEEAGDEIFETVEAETSDIEISEEYKQETVEAEIPHECEKDEDCAGVITDLKQCEVGKCESYKCVKKNAPENSECDDGNPCTFGDRCSGGFCIEGQNYCECEEDKDCKQYEDGG
ncbi:MAG: hypothetical protein FJ088_16035, partial [Deltaproteobacteria bacterium]|nr:hypothetical protein [Deltaproteobacteria bacterium]